MEELLAEAGFLRRLARGLATDVDADDLVQDTFVAALQHPPHDKGSIRGWLAKVAANLSRNARRASRRREDRERSVARDEQVEGNEISQERIELQRSLFQLLLTLPAEQRTVVYLRYYEERAPTWIAQHLGVPLKTVKTRHTRAMASLREKLDARSGGDRRAWMEALAPVTAFHGSQATAGVVGGLVVNKLVLAAVTVLLIAFAWVVIPHSSSVDHSSTGSPATAIALDAPTKSPLAPVADASSEVRQVAVERVAPNTGALEVHLTWSDGTPAASVGLEVQCANDPAPRFESFRAISDGSGIARFDALFAGKVKFVPDMRARFEGEVEAGAKRTITHIFEKGEEVRGRVVDAAGAPLADAAIWCKGADWNCPDTIRSVNCNADGSFRLRDVLGRARIDARAPHHRVSLCFEVERITVGPSGAREIDFVLGESGGRVRGHVLDPDGNSIEHAFVLAGPRGWAMREGTPGVEPQPATVETDKDGAFEIVEDLAPGKQPIWATARGFPIWDGMVDVAADATASIEIRLEHPARIEGRVIGLDDRPIAGVTVIASKEDRGGWFLDMLPASKATSDAEGRFALDWVKPGACEINASDSQRPDIGRGQSRVSCVAGQTTACDLRLERGTTIAGHVQDKVGTPLVGWKVYSEACDFENYWYPRGAKTGADGSFTLLNLGKGTHNLIVRAPDMQVAPRAHLSRVAVGTTDVLFVVDDAQVGQGTLRARLVDPSGHSLGDIEATLWKTGARMGGFLEVDTSTGVVESKVQPGRYRIQVRRSDVSLLVSDEIVVSENQITDAGDLRFGSLGRAEIRITGLPKGLEHLHLSLEGPGHLESGSLDWQDGAWKSNDLAAGRWVVSWLDSEIWLRDAVIEIPSGATGHFELVAEPAHSVLITFVNRGEGQIKIETLDAQGRLAAFCNVGLEPKDGKSSFQLPLPKGRSTVVVSTFEGSSGRVDVDVDARPHAPIEIPLH